MCDRAVALAVTYRFRRDAQEARPLEYAWLMLRTADDLEELARGRNDTTLHTPTRDVLTA